MATQLQLRKGTKVQNDMFTGAEAELTYDSTSKGLRLHDGTQQGGYEVPVLVAVQRPTAENNYTWFRVWSDGWVEQGQHRYTLSYNSATAITLPIEMADTYYFGLISGSNTSFAGNSTLAINPKSTTQVNLWNYNSASANMQVDWEVKGVRA